MNISTPILDIVFGPELINHLQIVVSLFIEYAQLNL